MSPIEDKVSKLVRPEIQALKAYHVPDSAGLIKLDAMENPYGWPEALKDEWLKVLRDVPINRYPDPAADALRAQLREALAVPAGMEVLLGNGSDELIQLIVMAVARPGAVVMAPTPTFVMYQMIATAAGLRFAGVPLANDYALDLDAMRDAIGEVQPAVIFLAYPNNPTGNLWDARAIEVLLAETAGLVVVDEAYHAFAQQSFMDRLGRYDNLLVLRTLSKQGLAGLRLGILAGDPVWLAELDKLRLPYNINSLTQASAAFALAHQNVLDEQAARLRADREQLFQVLATLPGVKAWPSRANFILFRTATRSATEVFTGLRERGVLIKNLDATIPGCLRVTVGTPEENAAFLAALKSVL
jgi:histidinol-phosphate aminotransferase